MAPIPTSLKEILAAGLAKKHQAIRSRLGIPTELNIDELQLEGLNYHLSERSGPVEVLLENEALRVRNPGSKDGILYRGDALNFLLQTWGITREQAQHGYVFDVMQGKRVA